MQRIFIFFRSEIVYYRERVAENARRLIVSNILRTFANPLMGIFLNAFVWRATGSLLALSEFNAAQFACLPIAFYVNGLLLKKVHIKKTFALGALLAGFSSLALVFFGGRSPGLIPVLGGIWGFGNGMYWGNRNYLELKETAIEWRAYFYGILNSLSSLANILMPILAGWFIVFGHYSHLYTAEHAYWILMGSVCVLFIMCAHIIWNGGYGTIIPERISRLSVRPIFNHRRKLQMAAGLLDGTAYLPALLILRFAGNEGILGNISAAAALCTMIALYIYGRRANKTSGRRSLRGSALLYLASTLALLLIPGTAASVIVYVVLLGVAESFSGVATSPIFLNLIDKENAGETGAGYSFIFDSELFLNIGRLIGIGIIVIFAAFISETVGLFVAPVIIALLHVGIVSRFLQRSGYVE